MKIKGVNNQGQTIIDSDVIEISPRGTSGEKAPLGRILRTPLLSHLRVTFITSLPVKRPHQGGYCATNCCSCAHPREPRMGHVTCHIPQPWYLYYCATFCTTTIVRKKRRKSRACAEHTSGYDVTSCQGLFCS